MTELKTQEWLKGKKTYIMLVLFCLFVVVTGEVPEGATDIIGGLDPEAIEKMLMAGVLGAIKAGWNRSNGGS